MTNVDKANKVTAALRQLGAESTDRPDVVYAIREFLTLTGPSTHCLLYDLVTRHDTPTSALNAIGMG